MLRRVKVSHKGLSSGLFVRMNLKPIFSVWSESSSKKTAQRWYDSRIIPGWLRQLVKDLIFIIDDVVVEAREEHGRDAFDLKFSKAHSNARMTPSAPSDESNVLFLVLETFVARRVKSRL